MAKGEAKARWDKENTVMVTLKLNKRTDAEIIEKLNSVEYKQRYIKELIKADMEQPSIEIVRCSECVHYQVEKWWCKQWTCGTPDNGWCYMGKIEKDAK